MHLGVSYHHKYRKAIALITLIHKIIHPIPVQIFFYLFANLSIGDLQKGLECGSFLFFFYDSIFQHYLPPPPFLPPSCFRNELSSEGNTPFLPSRSTKPSRASLKIEHLHARNFPFSGGLAKNRNYSSHIHRPFSQPSTPSNFSRDGTTRKWLRFDDKYGISIDMACSCIAVYNGYR